MSLNLQNYVAISALFVVLLLHRRDVLLDETARPRKRLTVTTMWWFAEIALMWWCVSDFAESFKPDQSVQGQIVTIMLASANVLTIHAAQYIANWWTSKRASDGS